MSAIITDSDQKTLVQNAVVSLPCLNSNISTENQTKEPILSTQQKKTAFILKASVEQLAEKHGIEKLGFLTLTFSDHILSPREAQRRLNSLISHVIKKRYTEYLGVLERQKSGRIHYHLLVVLTVDIRTGVDFTELSQKVYKSASPELRQEWGFWRKTAKKYGFGRTELLPVKKSIEAMAKYVGKYIAKHIDNRELRDHGVRLVRYSRGARVGTTKFNFKSEGSKAWRSKVRIFSQIVATNHDLPVRDLSDLTSILGPRWAYNNREFILSLPG